MIEKKDVINLILMLFNWGKAQENKIYCRVKSINKFLNFVILQNKLL